jgi:acetyl/propionyl-CoA carboxylase alpha subunit
VRDLLTRSAVALSREVGYTNAGTVEFLVDPDRGTDGVYFLEMNTRLQVEHPVTEEVVRVQGAPIDLVEAQLRIAAGGRLGFEQDDVTCVGHAIEARIYAEDAFGGFLPQAGTADLVRWSSRSRNDQALESGQVVGSSYDPMLGKVIVHAADRARAVDALVAALDETAILGLTTNTGYVRQLADSAAFRDAEIDTAWLDRHADAVTRPDAELPSLFAAACVAAVGVDRERSAFGAGDGWRLAGPAAPIHVDLLHDDEVARWQVHPDRVVGPSGETTPVRLASAEQHVLGLEIDGVVRKAVLNVTRTAAEVAWQGTTYSFGRPVPGEAAGSAAAADGDLLAQMPGTVLAVNVAEGDTVAAGTVLGVLEAMKMELALAAPYDGTVTHVGVTVGDQVPIRHLLFTVEEDA